jgi:hypothetical protein
VSRAKSVVARCVIPHDINPRLQDMTIQPLFSGTGATWVPRARRSRARRRVPSSSVAARKTRR